MSFQSRLDRFLAGKPTPVAGTVMASRLVFRVAHLLQARIDAALAPLAITMQEYLALALIADAAIEPLRPSDLSSTLDATRTQVTRLLDGLEHKGLAQRTPHAMDRRSLQLGLTAAGRTLLGHAQPLVHAAYEDAWKAMDTDELARTTTALRQVHDRLWAKDRT